MVRRAAIVMLLLVPLAGCGAMRKSWDEFSGHPDTTVASAAHSSSAKPTKKAGTVATAAPGKMAPPVAAAPPVVAARPTKVTAPPVAAPVVTAAPCISCAMTKRWSDKYPVLAANGAPVYPLPDDAAVQNDGWVFTDVATPSQVADWYALSFAKGGFHLSHVAVTPDGAGHSFCISRQVLFIARPVYDQIYAKPRTKIKVSAVVAPAVQPSCA